MVLRVWGSDRRFQFNDRTRSIDPCSLICIQNFCQINFDQFIFFHFLGTHFKRSLCTIFRNDPRLRSSLDDNGKMYDLYWVRKNSTITIFITVTFEEWLRRFFLIETYDKLNTNTNNSKCTDCVNETYETSLLSASKIMPKSTDIHSNQVKSEP